MHCMIQVIFLPSYFGLPIINTVSIHQMGHCQMAPRGDVYVCVGGTKNLPLGETHLLEIGSITFSAANLEVNMLT